MKSVFESMGGTYTQAGDYFFSDIALPKTSNRRIGKYGRMRHRYLKEHRPVIYSTMILDGTLWADTANAHLVRAGAEVWIDHHSHTERGLDEQPTIHEDVIARALERKGVIADRCEINRQIKADNALLRELKVNDEETDAGCEKYAACYGGEAGNAAAEYDYLPVSASAHRYR